MAKKTKKKQKPGPKPLKTSEKRIRRGELKANDAEWATLTKNAKRDGFTSVFVWLRELGISQTSKKRK